jgi:glucose-1-phosphate adenylyltransferase
MKIQADGRVIDFEEKPKTQEKLSRVRTDPSWLERLGLKAAGRPYLASMGIYLFNRSLLVDLLKSSTATDFGHELLPQSIAGHRVQAHLFDGYWEDIGTVAAFHQANIDLTTENPAFDFASEAGPIFTRPRFLACSRIGGATVKNSLICDGCVIGRGSVIENSVIGVRARVAENQRIGRPPFGVGANSVIERSIIDKNARIGRNVRVVNERGTVDSEDNATHVIRDGVVVIPKSAIVTDGTVI